MKGFSAFLAIRRYKDWAHKISSWKCLSKDLLGLEGPCSFLLGIDFVCILQEFLFPSVLWKFCNEIPLTSESDSLGILSPFARSPDWKVFVRPRTFARVRGLLWCDCSPVLDSPPGGSVVELMAASSKRTIASTCCTSQNRCSQNPCLRGSHWPVPPQETLKHKQIWFSLLWGSLHLSLGPGDHKVLFVPAKHLWRVWGLILNVTVPFLL